MSNVICNFCGHGNPEGSKFCNACGSPLNLTLCSQCEAMNSVSARQCHQCGAPLSSVETEETATPPAALTEITQSESLPTKDDPVPIALGERFGQLLGGQLVTANEPKETAAEGRLSLASTLTADPAGRDSESSLSPSPSGGATYPGRNPNRTRGFLLVLVVVAVAGAVYWTSMSPTNPPNLPTTTDGGNATTPEPVSSAPAVPAEPADNTKRSPTGDPLTDAGSLPSPAVPVESPALGRESSSPRSETGPSTEASSKSSATVLKSSAPGADATPQVAGQSPESEDAQGPSHAEAAESLGDGTATLTSAPAAGDHRRMVTQGRTKEQAKRDAIATSSLIARELANSPPADSENKSPPRP